MRVNQTERLRRSREFEVNQSRLRAHQIETMIDQFDRICVDLGQQIAAEEARARIRTRRISRIQHMRRRPESAARSFNGRPMPLGLSSTSCVTRSTKCQIRRLPRNFDGYRICDRKPYCRACY